MGIAGIARVKEFRVPAIVGDGGVAGRAHVVEIRFPEIFLAFTKVGDLGGARRVRVKEIRDCANVVGDRRDTGGVRIDDVEGAVVDHGADD